MSLQIAIALAFTCIIPASVGLRYWHSEGFSNGHRALIWLAIISIITEATSLIYILNHLGSTLWLFAPFTVFESWLVLYYLNQFVKSRWVFPIAPIVITIGTFSEIVFHTFFYNNFSTFLEGIIIASVLLYIGYRVITGNNMRLFDLVFCAAILFYFVTNLIYFLSIDFISGSPLIFMTNIHSVTNATSNVLYGYCLWKLGHTNSSQSVLLF